MEAAIKRKLPAATQQMLAHEAELEAMRHRHQVWVSDCLRANQGSCTPGRPKLHRGTTAGTAGPGLGAGASC